MSCIRDGEKVIAKDQLTFRTKLHKMYTIKQTKIALSPHDDKRYILSNNIDTFAHGHFRILRQGNADDADDVETDRKRMRTN